MTVTPPTLMSVPVTPIVLPVGVKLVPIRVTGKLVPRAPDEGVIEVSVGAGGAITVNVTALLVPLGVVMVTLLAVGAAKTGMAKVAVTVVLLTTVMPVIVMPSPDMVIPVAPVRLVPVNVTGTEVPRSPEVGAIEVSVGNGTVIWTSTAPTSTPAPEGLGLPKKSVEGATE